MIRRLWLTSSLAALALGEAAHAQTVLDRTDPTQGEEANRAEEPVPTPVRIEAERVLDQADDDRRYEIGPIVIEGAQTLMLSDFLDIIEQYSARNLSGTDLAGLAGRVAERARERGYIFATAWIEPQSLGSGVLRVRLHEGVIDEIRIEGEDDPAIRAQLEPLRDGRPVTLAEVERRVLLADDLAGVSIRRTRYEREGERGVLVVEASRSDFSGNIELDNSGSQPIGPERARLDIDANGLLSPYDEVDVTFSVTPFQPGELSYGRLRYGLVVNTSGTEIALLGSYSATEPGAYFADRDVFGEAWRVGAQIRHPLLRQRALSLWLEGEFELLDLRQERAGVLARHDRIPVIRAGFYSIAELASGILRGRLTVSRGLDVLGATELGDPLASRDDASANFTTLSAMVDWRGKLFDNFSLAMAGRGQLSTDPLLISEDIGLGGTRFLRGYNFNERSGDKGIMGFAELRYDWSRPLGLARRVQIYAFADGGVVGNLADGNEGGSLASGGGGLRAFITRRLELDIEVAVPLTGTRYDTGDKSPRFNLRIGHSF